MPVIIRSWFLGRVDYKRALKLQSALVDLNKRPVNKCPAHTILMLEHNPVYTVGIRSKTYSFEEQKKLEKLGAEFIKTNRGGLITYHGPGQLTAYPISILRGRQMAGKGIRWFVGALEKAGFQVCKDILGDDNVFKGSLLFPDSTGATGVWVDKEHKLMSIGIHRSGDVTYHGIALNCTEEPLAWFDQIVPCGLTHCSMTSLATILGDPNLANLSPSEVAPRLSEAFFQHLFNAPRGDNNADEEIEFTYSDFLADEKSVAWEKIEKFILEDADFRTKNLPRAKEL